MMENQDLNGLEYNPAHRYVSQADPEVITHRSVVTSLMIHAMIFGGLASDVGLTPESEPVRAADELNRPVKENRSVDEILEHLEQVSINNKEVLAALEKVIEKYVDELITKYIESEDASIQAPLEVYATLDAFRQARTKVENVRHLKLDLDALLGEAYAYRDALLQKDADLTTDLIANPAFTWTCDPLVDFPTYQEAMFLGSDPSGDDRYFYSPRFDVTQYQEAHWAFDRQLANGIVNCQVARMTPIKFVEIYEAHCPGEDVLHKFRVVDWVDHVHTGYVSEGVTYTFREGVLDDPVVQGLQPGNAVDPGVLLPIKDHLALYLLLSKVNDSQRERLKAVISGDSGEMDGGYPLDDAGRFSEEDAPEGIQDFINSGEGSTENDAEVSDVGSIEFFNEEFRGELNAEEDWSFYTEAVAFTFNYHVAREISKFLYLSNGVSMIEIPDWLDDAYPVISIGKSTSFSGESTPPEIIDAFERFTAKDILINYVNPWIEFKLADCSLEGQEGQITEMDVFDSVINCDTGFVYRYLDRLSHDPFFLTQWNDIDVEKIESQYSNPAFTWDDTQEYVYNIPGYIEYSEYLARKTGNQEYLANIPSVGFKPLYMLSASSVAAASQVEFDEFCNGYIGLFRSTEPNGIRFPLGREQDLWHVVFDRANPSQKMALITEILRVTEITELSAHYPLLNRLAGQSSDMSILINDSLQAARINYFNDRRQLGYNELDVLLRDKDAYAHLAPYLDGYIDTCIRGNPDISNFNQVYYGISNIAGPPKLETMDDFRALIKHPTYDHYGNTNAIQLTQDYEYPNSEFRAAITKLYRATFDPADRMEILMMPNQYTTTVPFIAKKDVFPEDIEMLRSIDPWSFTTHSRSPRLFYDYDSLTLQDFIAANDEGINNAINVVGSLGSIAAVDPETFIRIGSEYINRLEDLEDSF